MVYCVNSNIAGTVTATNNKHTLVFKTFRVTILCRMYGFTAVVPRQFRCVWVVQGTTGNKHPSRVKNVLAVIYCILPNYLPMILCQLVNTNNTRTVLIFFI